MDDDWNFAADPYLLPGVWANEAQVLLSPREFTIDFLRIDYGTLPPHPAFLVARVAIAPQGVNTLLTHLTHAWERYTDSFLPPEARRGISDS